MAHKHSDGNWYPHPERPTARHLRYSPHHECELCHVKAPRYNHSDNCVLCARNQALAFYRWFHDVPDYFNISVGVTPDYGIDMHQWNVLTNMVIADKSAYIVQMDPCKKSGHIGLMYASTGKCVMCNYDSPRQFALRIGENWYELDELCSCGRNVMKHVSNGRIKRCVCEEENEGRN